jgi:hypothetical protein
MIAAGSAVVAYKYNMLPSPTRLFTNIHLFSFHLYRYLLNHQNLHAQLPKNIMFIKSLLLIILASSLQLGATATQVNYYSDTNCADFVGSANPGDCEAIPSGIGSWLAVCGSGDSCLEIETFSSNGGDCADEHAVTAAQCSCNGDPGVDDSGKCINASGQTFWSTIVVSIIPCLSVLAFFSNYGLCFLCFGPSWYIINGKHANDALLEIQNPDSNIP